MDFKLKVTGTSQNSTALGIMHAYVRLFPDSTLEDLRRAFPNEIAPDNGVKQIFQPIKQAKALNDESESFTGYFATVQRPPLTLSDGSQVAVCQVWTSSSLARLVEKAKAFGIDAEVCKGQKPDVGFRIDILEGSAGASEVKDSLVCSSESDEKKAKIYAPIFAFLFFQGGVWSDSRKQNEEAFATVAKELGINQDCFLKHVHSLIDPFSMIEEGDGSGEDDADYENPILDEGYGVNWDKEDCNGCPNLMALAYDEDNLSKIPSEEQDTFLHAAVNFLLSKNTIEDYGLRGIGKIWEKIDKYNDDAVVAPIFEMLKIVVATAKKRDYQVWIQD